MAKAVLTISSKNYSSWSLRGWLLCKMAGLDFEEKRLSIDDPDARAELLLLSPSFLTPALEHKGQHVWDTLAIAEYLAETFPKALILPEAYRRAHAQPVGFRRNALGLQQSALGPADEHQGAFPQFSGLVGRQAGHRARLRDLARLPQPLWRAVPVRQATDPRRRHVRSGLLAFRHL